MFNDMKLIEKITLKAKIHQLADPTMYYSTTAIAT